MGTWEDWRFRCVILIWIGSIDDNFWRFSYWNIESYWIPWKFVRFVGRIDSMPFEAPRIEPLQRWRPWMLQSWKETTRPWLPGRFGNCFCSRSAVAVFFVLWAAQKKDFLNVRSQKRPQSWLNMATWMCQLPTSEGSGWQSVYAASLHQRLHDILQFCNNVWATKGWQCRGVSFQTLTFQVRMVRIYMNREYIYMLYI